jgi:rhodanese-related sulfurtransferase
MRHILAALCLLAAFAARAEIVDVDNAELARLTAAGVPLIDIRTAQEWQETGIVPGSHLITFFDERGKADPAAWLEKAKAVAKPGEPVAVICRSGNRTRAVSQFLSQQAGYGKVYNAREGIRGWTRENRPVASAAPALAACRAARTC